MHFCSSLHIPSAFIKSITIKSKINELDSYFHLNNLQSSLFPCSDKIFPNIGKSKCRSTPWCSSLDCKYLLDKLHLPYSNIHHKCLHLWFEQHLRSGRTFPLLWIVFRCILGRSLNKNSKSYAKFSFSKNQNVNSLKFF